MAVSKFLDRVFAPLASEPTANAAPVIPDSHRVVVGGHEFDLRVVTTDQLNKALQKPLSVPKLDATEVLGARDDRFLGDWRNEDVLGSDGDDVLTMRAGDDRAFGGLGNDALHGNRGSDRLMGREGEDRLFGGYGDDWLRGDEGDDVLFGGAGLDRLHGGAGDDVLYAGEGLFNKLYGGAGDDLAIGGAGDDWIFTTGGNDTLLGAEGDDRMRAGSGDDILACQEGADWMFGMAGNDVLTTIADQGRPTLTWAQRGQRDANFRLDDRMNGDSGADDFQFMFTAGGATWALSRYADATGTIDWDRAFAGQWNGLWLEDIGYDKVMDYNARQGDTLTVIGNHVAIGEIVHGTVKGEQTSFVHFVSDDGVGGTRPWEGMFLGTAEIRGAHVDADDFQFQDDRVAYVTETLGDLG